jgi:predicted secreted protein
LDCRDKLRDLTKAAGYKWPPEEVAVPTAGGAAAALKAIHKKRKLNTGEAAVDQGEDVVVQLLIVDPDTIDTAGVQAQRIAAAQEELKVWDEEQGGAERTEKEEAERAALVELSKGKTDATLTFQDDQVSTAYITLKDSTITLSSLVIPIRERSLCQGREPRAMYGALFEVGDNPDWSEVSVRNRLILVDDQAVRSWLL